MCYRSVIRFETIALNADGSTTMTSPDGRAYHSHSPPATTAA